MIPVRVPRCIHEARDIALFYGGTVWPPADAQPKFSWLLQPCVAAFGWSHLVSGQTHLVVTLGQAFHLTGTNLRHQHGSPPRNTAPTWGSEYPCQCSDVSKTHWSERCRSRHCMCASMPGVQTHMPKRVKIILWFINEQQWGIVGNNAQRGKTSYCFPRIWR